MWFCHFHVRDTVVGDCVWGWPNCGETCDKARRQMRAVAAAASFLPQKLASSWRGRPVHHKSGGS